MSIKPLFNAFRDYISLMSHDVLDDWLTEFNWNLNERNLAPNTMPALSHLERAAQLCGRGQQVLANQLVAHQDQLQWLQSYTADDFGAYFTQHYCFTEIIGTRGHFVSNEFAAGLVLYGPNIDYPDHWHVADEIYLPLSDTGLWSSDRDDYQKRRAGDIIYHSSNMPHAIRTGDEPLLAAYVWHGGDLAQKSDY